MNKMLKYVDNPLVKGVAAGVVTAGLLAASPAYAPIGVVGATGWLIVKGVAIGTVCWDVAERKGYI